MPPFYIQSVGDGQPYPPQMKDQIMALLDGWKEKQPPELGKGEKKVDMEK